MIPCSHDSRTRISTVTDRPNPPRGPHPHPLSAAFLLTQIGSHAAARFAERLSVLELAPAQAGILRAIAARAGTSQQELAGSLGMLPSRLVPFLDELEARELVERRDHPGDRRLYALHLTPKGTRLLGELGRVAREHDAAICAALSGEERAQLGALLGRIADEQGLAPGVHPGFARISNPGKPSARVRAEPASERSRRARGRSGRGET
jgi:DNA-binding MarR family transcriptional regulator